MNYIKSPLNYTGGKYELLPQILPLFPQKINTFYDLLGGGFNVGINVNCNKVIHNDLLKPLSDLMCYFNNNTIDDILSYIENTIKKYNLSKSNKNSYIEFRENYNKTKSPIDLYILSCYSFNYMIRFNSKMEFNMPVGIRHFSPSLKSNIINFKSRLESINVEFLSKDFKDISIDDITSSDFVYCDPPYLISNATYNEKRGVDGWGETSELELLGFLDKLNERDIKFALSNVIKHKGLTNNILMNWMEKYNVTYLTKQYSNCNYQLKNRNKDETVEVLITNYIPQIKHKKTLLDFISEL